MDLYLPPDAAPDRPLPVVVFVHGGPVRAGLPLAPKDWGIFQSYGALAAAAGMAGVGLWHPEPGMVALSRTCCLGGL